MKPLAPAFALALMAATVAVAQDGPEAPAPEPAPASTKKASLAVFPLGWRVTSIDTNNHALVRLTKRFDTTALTTRLVHALVNAGKFDVVDREHIQRYLNEMDLGERGILDPARAVRAGKAIGADYFLMGEVRAFNVQTIWRPIPYSKDGKAHRIITARLAADLRIVDTRTTKIVAADTCQATFRDQQLVPNDYLPEGPALEALVEQLRGELAQAIVRDAVERIYPLRITEVDGQTVTLDRGKADGLSVGQVFDVFGASGDPVVDLDTGKPADDLRVKLGQLRIVEVGATTSRAAALRGAVFPRGAVCRTRAEAPTSRPADSDPRGPEGW